MIAATVERRRALLATLGRVERGAGLHRGWLPRTYEVHADRAVRRGSRLADAPGPVRALGPGDGDVPHALVRVRARSDLIRFGKFDHDGGGRLRGFLLRGDEAVTVKLQTRASAARGGVAREVAARREVAELAPHLAPRLLADGIDERGGVAYLVEPVVRGEHPAGRRGVTAAAGTILAAVVPLYAASGPEGQRIAEVFGPRTEDRWAQAVAAVPRLRPLDDAVRHLVRSDRELDVALVHGDLVASNVLLLPDGGVQLVDWEFSRRYAIAHDLAKLLLQANDRATVLRRIDQAAGHLVGVGPDAYSLHEQLALVQVLMFSWHEHRAAKAAAAGRTKAYARDVRRRAALLRDLLGVSGTV